MSSLTFMYFMRSILDIYQLKESSLCTFGPRLERKLEFMLEEDKQYSEIIFWLRTIIMIKIVQCIWISRF